MTYFDYLWPTVALLGQFIVPFLALAAFVLVGFFLQFMAEQESGWWFFASIPWWIFGGIAFITFLIYWTAEVVQ